MTLTDKQRRFVDEYMSDLNATQAAIRAGYSEKTARSQGQRLLTNVDIAAAIRTGQARLADDVKVTQQLLLNELWANHQAATAAGQWSASTRALEVMAKMTGNMVERRDVTMRTLDDMDEDELIAEKARLGAEIAALKAKGHTSH